LSRRISGGRLPAVAAAPTGFRRRAGDGCYESVIFSILDIDLFFGWGVYSATNEGGTPLAALCFALVISFLWDEFWGLNGTVFCLGYEGFGSLLFDN
jgi:hypothetical protein